MSSVPHDPWFFLASRTTARIGLGRSGVSLPTREVLSFDLAHAQARDAVNARFNRVALTSALAEMGLSTVEIESQVTERAAYLRRPDFGRKPSVQSLARLQEAAGDGCDIAIMIGDGLSAGAVGAHAPGLLSAFLPSVSRLALRLGQITLAEGARVALGDDVGAALKARMVVVIIGERPGLSAIDSLGIYLTYDPRPGRLDSERNCISNIRPEGLSLSIAAQKLTWLVEAAFSRRLTGIALKDESEVGLEGAHSNKKLD